MDESLYLKVLGDEEETRVYGIYLKINAVKSSLGNKLFERAGKRFDMLYE